MSRWRWAEQCHIVPSPLVGEGQGEGYNARYIASYLTSTKCSQLSSLSLYARASFALGASSPPLSLSLPHKGGGNRGARTFVTHATCLWAGFQLSIASPFSLNLSAVRR
jgi:hypothetical protein